MEPFEVKLPNGHILVERNVEFQSLDLTMVNRSDGKIFGVGARLSRADAETLAAALIDYSRSAI